MKNILIISVISTGLMLGCGNQASHVHDHDSETIEAHDHSGFEEHEEHLHEGPNHTHEGLSHEEHAPHDHGQTGHDAQAEAQAGVIVFTEAQAAASSDFALYTVKPETFHNVIPASGQILPAQGSETSVVASFSGIIRLPAKKLLPGTSVTQGETLFYVSSKEIAEGDYATRIEANYQQAKAAYERAEKLIGDKIISQAEYETAKTDYETASAAREALGNKVSQQGTAISSPLSGFIKNISVTEGQYVEVGQPLATVSQNRRLVLQAEVSQRYLSGLNAVRGANFLTPYDGQIYALEDLNGRLLSTGKASDGRSAYLPVSFEFDNRGNVLPGAFVKIYLISTPMQEAITVPVSALTEDQGNYFVYVQLSPEHYRRQQVILGANDGQRVQIVSGLQAGDVVVSQGATLVKMASFSGAIPHSHTH